MDVETELTALARRSGRRLSTAGLSLATAESCTGGWIAKVVTDVAGSSVWFERGFVCYSNTAKQEMLGVSTETLDRFGAVSEQTAGAMAKGALDNSGAGVSVAVTGVAGPGGGTEDKPVGLVWIAWCGNDGRLVTREKHFEGDREAVRRATVRTSLQGLLEFIDEL